MKREQVSPEPISAILRPAEKGEQAVATICREHGSAEGTVYRWRKTDGGMSVSAAARRRERERENARQERLLAERALEREITQERVGTKREAWALSERR